jgi:hypothetical protein
MSGGNGSPVPFDEPSSVQFDGRRMIVTNDAFFSGNASHFVIFDVYAGEPGAPVFVPGRKATKPSYALSVSPRRATVGAERTFRFHATRSRKALAGGLVSFAGRHVRTDSAGNARIVVSFARAGSRLATLSPPGSGRTVAKASVKVVPAPGGGDSDTDRAR